MGCLMPYELDLSKTAPSESFECVEVFKAILFGGLFQTSFRPFAERGLPIGFRFLHTLFAVTFDCKCLC